MDPIAHRESARMSDPADLADKVATIRQRLHHNRRARLQRITTPLNDDEKFAIAEAELEREKWAGR